MAFRAHRLPTLGDAGPVQRVVGFKFVVDVWRAKVKPTLVDRVPADSQHLDSADFVGRCISFAIKFDHVLLKRLDTEDIFDFEVFHLASWSLGVDHEFVAIAKQAADDAVRNSRRQWRQQQCTQSLLLPQ